MNSTNNQRRRTYTFAHVNITSLSNKTISSITIPTEGTTVINGNVQTTTPQSWENTLTNDGVIAYSTAAGGSRIFIILLHLSVIYNLVILM